MSIIKSFFPKHKWGQGMLARWSALLILVAVFAWGSYSAYEIMYAQIGWLTEVPLPGKELPEENLICAMDTKLSPSDAEAIVNIGDFDKDENGFYIINEGDDYTLSAGVGTNPVNGEQRNGSGIPWAAVVALLILVLFFWLSWRIAHGRKGSEILLETEHELRKVVWPSKQRILNSSIVVVFTMTVISLILFFSDILINLMIKDVLRLW